MAQDDIDSEDLEELEVEGGDDDEDLEDEPEDLDDDEEFEEESDEDAADDEADEDDSEEESSSRRKAKDDDDDDDEMLSPDDVEADLDMILKDRMVAADAQGEDEEEESAPRTDEKAEAIDGIQPKRADEQLCTSCFLLVRANAPSCPVGDDDCPVFS